MIVVLTEKPSAARNFAKALGGMSGSFQGNPYKIASLRGHLMELDKDFNNQVPSSRVPFYTTWSLDNLPWNPSELAYRKIVKADCEKLLDSLSEDLRGADEVVIATDNDPSGEGELLAWEALEHVGWQGRTTRAFFADEAPKSIIEAFEKRSSIPSMAEDGDYLKALARERFDFCSMQFVRISTCLAREHGFNTVVRQGRLKSVIVSLVGDQQKAYDGYVKKPFYEARFCDENGNIFKLDIEDIESIRFKTKDEVDLSALSESKIKEDSVTHKHTSPGKLLDLSALSAILAKEGYKPNNVLATYQKMYEDQIVSYPRTEDKFITPEQFNELSDKVDQIADLVGINKSLLTHRAPRTTHVKDGCAHGANRPGMNVPASLDALNKYGSEAQAIYILLAKNYLAMLAEDYEYDQIKAHLVSYPEFTSIAHVPTALGFKAVFDSESLSKDENESKTKRRFGKTAKPFVFEGSNKRPQKPTMKWLNTRLEKYNVGTGATRTSTLADITQGGDKALLSENKGALSLTSCGKVSWQFLQGCSIGSPEVTEELFERMSAVGRFEETVDNVVGSITELVIADLETMKRNAELLGDLSGATIAKIGACPVCGKPVLERGKMLVCSSNKNKKCDDGSWVQVEGCGFRMFAQPFFFGKRLTKAQAIKLLSGSRVLVKGLKSKAGKSYEAYATLAKGPDVKGFYSLENAGFPERRKTTNKRKKVTA